ncbi:DUF4097 family beta strand repeat-containing protein [Streptomyces alkaliphilus]|uniref:DUF4097 family beta strand repeat-containing protein n=1 Tax=Streptomyces alkaliphilus TaxID=1472722 RepID=UPI00117C02D9|nr:DUF4097 family beta strand repeat-containing protein [Streptomyces alkaliphilus]MQS07114.1 hypothetical protein [Streptomyces alkaliphilus]
MPSFDSPEPISVTAYVYAGSLRLTATDRRDTVVEVRPLDPKKDRDVRAADRTEVTYEEGVLTVTTPKANPLGRGGAVDVAVELPTGSGIDVTGAGVNVIGEGRLGEVAVKTTAGDVRLDTTGPLRLNAPHGSSTIDRVEGMAAITGSTGNLRVGLVDGPAVLKNSHGTTTVRAVTGELRVSGTTGGIDVGRAEASVVGTTTHGPLRVGEVACGNIRLETSNGPIEVGVREGVDAWLDVNSNRGQVRVALTAHELPERAENTVTIRARTNWGNIDVLRAEV